MTRLPKLINHLKRIFGARRAGLLKLRPVSSDLRFKCLGAECGKCCEAIGVTGDQASTITAITHNSQPRQSVGNSTSCPACPLFDLVCTAYEDRPAGCKEYPWYNVGGALFFDSGCPGIGIVGDGPPDLSSITPVESYLEVPSFIRRPMLWILSRW